MELGYPMDTTPTDEDGQVWDIYVDGSSNSHGSGAGIIIIDPNKVKICYALQFGFKASNNEAEYEAIIAGLRMSKALGAKRVHIKSDSQLVVSQITAEYQAKEENMKGYLGKTRELMSQFSEVKVERVPRLENSEADNLAKMASLGAAQLTDPITSEHIPVRSINLLEPLEVGSLSAEVPWMEPIIRYLKDGDLPSDKSQARKLKYMAARYCLIQGTLYRRGFTLPYLKWLGSDQAEYVMREIHEGICGNHYGAQSLAQKALRQGYYWPTMWGDAKKMVRMCDKCQRFARVPHLPLEKLTVISSPWPFAIWGVDFIGPLPIGKEQAKHAIVAVDYFTKWAEAEPLTNITERKTTELIWKNLICRYGIPNAIVSDNGKQFDNEKFRSFCSELGIANRFATPAHPQSNGQVEAVNKIIKGILKKKLEERKGAWVDELPGVLWAYRTTQNTSTGETPFSLAFGVDAVIPAEIGVPSHRVEYFDEAENASLAATSLDLVAEKRARAELRIAAYQHRISGLYKKWVRPRSFKKGDLVLRRITQNTRVPSDGTFGANWEGPYRVDKPVGSGAYKLLHMDGTIVRHPWNAAMLRKYY